MSVLRGEDTSSGTYQLRGSMTGSQRVNVAREWQLNESLREWDTTIDENLSPDSTRPFARA